MTQQPDIGSALAGMMATGGVLFLLYMLMTLMICGFSLAAVALWVWMIIDCANHQVEDKPMWLLVVILGNWIGALVYYFVCRKKRLAAASAKTRQWPRVPGRTR